LKSPRGHKGYRIWSPSVDPEYVAWGADTKLHYAERIGCPEDEDYDDKTEDIYSGCLSPFMLWSTPATVAFALVIFALTAYVLDPHDVNIYVITHTHIMRIHLMSLFYIHI
jgi:hypothetical protein